MTWEPVGPCLIVTPGNIPMHAWSSFVPYALAAGCSVVVSPSRQDPVAAEWICRTANEVGWPKGSINLVHGGRDINKFILKQPEIQGLGFIGSTSAGWDLFKQCAEAGINSSINGNGKNTVVVMPDADLETSPVYMRQGCFGLTGQRCLGSDNVVIVGDVYDEIKERLVAQAKSMKLGYGLDEAIGMGPYATAQGRDKVSDWVDRALAPRRNHGPRRQGRRAREGLLHGGDRSRKHEFRHADRQGGSLRGRGRIDPARTTWTRSSKRSTTTWTWGIRPAS